MESKLKHLEFIQGVVNRLATDSFRMKGWAIVLVSALLVLLGGDGERELVSIVWVPVLVFWGLDGYFVWQERLFRALYDHVRSLGEDAVDFSMDVSGFCSDWKHTWLGATFSRTLISFYGVLVFVVGYAGLIR